VGAPAAEPLREPVPGSGSILDKQQPRSVRNNSQIMLGERKRREWAPRSAKKKERHLEPIILQSTWTVKKIPMIRVN